MISRRGSVKLSRFIIGIDFDDTVNTLLEGWLEWLNNRYETCYTTRDIKQWDICSYFPLLTRDEVYAPLNQELFWEKYVRVDVEATTYIKQLIEDGHEVYIVTASTPETLYYKWEHLISNYLPFINSSNIIMCSNKQLLSNLDILIDDGLHNLVGGKYLKILVDKPYNQQTVEKDMQDGILRCKTWKNIYNIINKRRNYNND